MTPAATVCRAGVIARRAARPCGAKGQGDFTAIWPEVNTGTGAFLEGPYGAFTLDAQSDGGAVFFAGGVGITPIMSMLRTLAARNDQRTLVLYYANKRWEDVIFRDEIETLGHELNLEVIHVLEQAPKDWQGEVGLLDKDVLERHMPEQEAHFVYFICGPEPMMDIVESLLVKRDIPLPQIRSERFEIV